MDVDKIDVDDYSMLQMILRQLNEAQARWFVAREAILLGHGGIKQMQDLTGMSRPTISRGIRELQEAYLDSLMWGFGRVRIPGGGRKPLLKKDEALPEAIEKIMIESTAGDPMRPLYWTQKSTRSIADELTRQGHTISASTVGRRLHEMGYSLQVTRKNIPDKASRLKDEQFHYINTQVEECINDGRPAIFIDCQKSKDQNRTKQKPTSDSVDVREDCLDFTSVRLSPQIFQFASESIHQWWRLMGRLQFPKTEALFICANCGSSGADHLHEWHNQLQSIADEFGLLLTVSHVPSATIRWNILDRQMSSLISLSCQDRALVDYRIVVVLVSETRSKSNIHIEYDQAAKSARKGPKLVDGEMPSLNLRPQKTLPQWNYTITSSQA